jgi:hypothetical protein
VTTNDAERGTGGGAPGSRRNFSEGEPAVIALRMESLTVWMVERVAKMPRDFKYSVGDKLVEACLSVTTLLVDASFAREKRHLLVSANHALTRARVLVRIAQRLKLLSSAQREYFATESLEVGKMLGGWTRSVSPRYSSAAVSR